MVKVLTLAGSIRRESFNRRMVLYFYPKENTSGCTREALDFSLLRGLKSEAGKTVAEKQ